MLGAEPVLRALCFRGVAEQEMGIFSLVERGDVAEEVDLGSGPRAATDSARSLILHAVKEALRWRVDPAASITAHQAACPVSLPPHLDGVTGTLAYPSGESNQSRRQLHTKLGQRQGVTDYGWGHRRFYRPADHVTTEQIAHILPVCVVPDGGRNSRHELVIRHRREVPAQQRRRHHPAMVRTHRRFEPRLRLGLGVVFRDQSLNTLHARWKPTGLRFFRDARSAVGVCEFPLHHSDDRHHRRIRGARTFPRPVALPNVEAGDIDTGHTAQNGQLVLLVMRHELFQLHNASPAKFAAAFIEILFSRRNLALSAHTIEIPSSDVSVLACGTLSFPSATALARPHSFWSMTPSSRTALLMLWPIVTRFTTSFLNSAMKHRFSVTNRTSPSMQVGRPYIRLPWKTTLQGKFLSLGRRRQFDLGIGSCATGCIHSDPHCKHDIRILQSLWLTQALDAGKRRASSA